MPDVRVPMPLLPYAGGKRKIAREIVDRLELSKGETLCEVFAGMAAVSMTALRDGHSVWLNDGDKLIAGLWRMVQADPEPLIDGLYKVDPSPDALTEAKAWLNREREPTELEGPLADRSAILAAVLYKSFNGITDTKAGYRPRAYKPEYIAAQVRKYHRLLQGAWMIGNQDFRDCIRMAEGMGAVLYCDPPYISVSLYSKTFSMDDQRDLAETLKAHNRRWLLSLDDVPEAWSLYSWAEIERVRVGKDVELLISAKGSGITRSSDPCYIPPMAKRPTTAKALFKELEGHITASKAELTVKFGGGAMPLYIPNTGIVTGEDYGAMMIDGKGYLLEIDRKGTNKSVKAVTDPDAAKIAAIAKQLLPEPEEPEEVKAARQALEAFEIPKGYRLEIVKGKPTLVESSGGTGSTGVRRGGGDGTGIKKPRLTVGLELFKAGTAERYRVTAVNEDLRHITLVPTAGGEEIQTKALMGQDRNGQPTTVPAFWRRWEVAA